MAFPVILVNSATGSDTAASGAGPSTAVAGTGASLNASTSVDLSADAPDLSGVAVDGSACLWVKTSSGRQYSRITAVDNGTKIVTVATAYGVTEASRTWAIGGKRATLDHADTKTLGADAEPGWIIEIAAGDTQTLTNTFTWTADGDTTSGRIVIRGASGTRAIVTSATNSVALFTLNAANYLTFSHLNLTHTAGTRGAAFSFTGISDRFKMIDCVVDGCLNAVVCSSSPTSPAVRNCEVKNCTGAAFSLRGAWLFFATYIHDNAGSGTAAQTNASMSITMVYCVVVKNGGVGVGVVGVTSNTQGCTIQCSHCVIADNTSNGIENAVSSGGPGIQTFRLDNNIIYGNGGWGVLCADTQAETDAAVLWDTNNAFGANSSGARSGISAGENEITLTANPFTNDSGSNRDFSLNNTAGGGAACRAAGFPGAFVGATFVGYPDVGAVQHQDAGGGGKAIPSVGMRAVQ